MIIICWHSLGFLINFRQPQDNSYLFFEESTVCAASGIFFCFLHRFLIFNINFDIYFH